MPLNTSKHLSISEIAKMYNKSKKAILDFTNSPQGEALEKEPMKSTKGKTQNRFRILNNSRNLEILESRFNKNNSLEKWEVRKAKQEPFIQINPTIEEQLDFVNYLLKSEIPIRFPFQHLNTKNYYNNNKTHTKERKAFFHKHLENLLFNSLNSVADTLNDPTFLIQGETKINFFEVAGGDDLRIEAFLKKFLPKILKNPTEIYAFELDSSRVATKEILFSLQKKKSIFENKYKQKTKIVISLFENTLEENNFEKVFEYKLSVKDLIFKKGLELKEKEDFNLNGWLLELEDLNQDEKRKKLNLAIENILESLKSSSHTAEQILEISNILSFLIKAQKSPYSYIKSFDIVQKPFDLMASLHSQDSEIINIFSLLGTYLDELDYLDKIKVLSNLKESLINPQDIIILESSIETENNYDFVEKTRKAHLDLYKNILEEVFEIEVSGERIKVLEINNSKIPGWKVVWTSPKNYELKMELLDQRKMTVKIKKGQEIILDRYQPMNLERLVGLIQDVGLNIVNLSANSQCGSCALVLQK